MRFLFAALIPLLCLAAVVAQDQPPQTRFAAVDVVVDPKGQPLAAWQIEFTAEPGEISLVGVEAGEHPAYAARPPYYDPAALAGRRIILADYSLAKDLPNTPARVARVMLEIRGPQPPQYVAKVMAAADPSGKPIPATVTLK
jgi:hypothetical protein